MPDRRAEILGQIREHARKHRTPDACAWCGLWDAFRDNDKRAVDAFLAQFNGHLPDDIPPEVIERLREIRSNWGEGDWTNPDLENDQ